MADKIGNLQRIPSLKRSWADFQAVNDTETGSGDIENPSCPTQALKRSRDSSSDVPGNDTGYASSPSEAPDAAPPSECENSLPALQQADSTYHSNSPDSGSRTDGGLWFKAEENGGHEASPDEASPVKKCPSTSSDISSTTIKEDDGVDDAAEANENDISEISGLSDSSMDGEGWRPMSGPMRWVHQHMIQGTDPRVILRRLVPDCSDIPESFSNMALWKIILQIISEPPRRKKLPDVSSLTDVVELIKKSKKIMVLTGAGVSVSCGIPDFRSRDGVYARLSVEYPDLPDPQAMFDISYFLKNPRPFFKFAKELYPGQFEPSLSHKFIRLIERQGHLLRNYTQNIDTLEQVAGIEGVLQCHGSFANATCLVCKHKVDADVIRQDIMNQVIPHCPQCPAEDEDAIMKPDIVFFGESLPQEFHNQMDVDKDVCDLLIVMGSSLKVRPVALIPNSLPANVPQVLINREPLKHLTFDVELLGDCDVIVNELCHQLGSDWSSVCRTTEPASEITMNELATPSISPDTSQEAMPHVDSSSNLSMVGRLEKTHLNGPDSTSEDVTPTTKQDCETPTLSIETPAMSIETPAMSSETPAMSSETPTMSSETPALSSEMPAPSSETLAVSSETSVLSGEEIEKLRTAWKPKAVNLASKLKDGTFLFVSPNRYVFNGAEAYDDENDDVSSSSMSSFRDSEDEETSEAVAKGIKEDLVATEADKRHFEIFAESLTSDQ